MSIDRTNHGDLALNPIADVPYNGMLWQGYSVYSFDVQDDYADAVLPELNAVPPHWTRLRLRSNEQDIQRWLNYYVFGNVCCPANIKRQNLFPLLRIRVSLFYILSSFVHILSWYSWVTPYDPHGCHRMWRFCIGRAFGIDWSWWTKRWYPYDLIYRVNKLHLTQ